MSIFQIIMIILGCVPIIGTILYHVFVVGKAFTTFGLTMTALGTAISNLDKTFSTTVANLEKTFNLQLNNLSKNFEDMKDTQEKFAELINDIVIHQMGEMKTDITRISENCKSNQHRLDCIERKQ